MGRRMGGMDGGVVDECSAALFGWWLSRLHASVWMDGWMDGLHSEMMICMACVRCCVVAPATASMTSWTYRRCNEINPWQERKALAGLAARDDDDGGTGDRGEPGDSDGKLAATQQAAAVVVADGGRVDDSTTKNQSQQDGSSSDPTRRGNLLDVDFYRCVCD